jgi:hypothetical protein
MTALYGSEAQPKRLFGDKVDAFYAVMQRLAPGAWELNQALLSFWDKTHLQNDWILPDGFDVRVKVMGRVTDHIRVLDQPLQVERKVNMPSEYGRSLGANCIHSVDGMVVRDVLRYCSHDPAQLKAVRLLAKAGANGKGGARTRDGEWVAHLDALADLSGYLSPRIVEHLKPDTIGLLSQANRARLDAVLAAFPAKPFRVLTVHDCFRVLPNNGNALRRTYNHILSAIAGSNMLDYLTSQIARRPLGARQLDPEMHRDVLEANYALS